MLAENVANADTPNSGRATWRRSNSDQVAGRRAAAVGLARTDAGAYRRLGRRPSRFADRAATAATKCGRPATP